MIVAELFQGDDDTEIAWKQHDVYNQALQIIVGTCQSYARFARRLLNDQDHDPWGYVEKFGHKAIQSSHDLLAAVWRYKNDLRQNELPFIQRGPADVERLWLAWLRDEVESWTDAPDLVRHVITILANQNQPLGYAAESELALGILRRFSGLDIQWKNDLETIFEASLEKDRLQLPQVRTGA